MYVKEMWQWDWFLNFFKIQIGLAGVPYTNVKAFLIQIRGDICKKKLTPAINDTRSRRLCVSVLQKVANPPYCDTAFHWLNDSQKWGFTYRFYFWKTLCIDDTEKCWLSVSVIRWVVDSPYCVIWGLVTPRIIDKGSRRFRTSVKWRVTVINLEMIC